MAQAAPTLAAKETLLSAYDALGYAQRRVAGGDFSRDALIGEVRAINRLYDAALDCGMSHEEPSVETWAALWAGAFLTSGVEA